MRYAYSMEQVGVMIPRGDVYGLVFDDRSNADDLSCNAPFLLWQHAANGCTSKTFENDGNFKLPS